MKWTALLLLLSLTTLLSAQNYDFIVAQDGSGDFITVQAAIEAVPHLRKKRTYIFIKNGVYKEKLDLPASKENVSFVGEDVQKTILTFDDFASIKNVFGEEVGTSGSASFFVYGDGFEAYNLTFENSAGPVGQAVAVRVSADKVKFVNCRFLGFQDTLYTYGRASRQYYKDCYIEGTVDFIFGSSTAYFEHCDIFCKKGGFVTAASTPADRDYGYVFDDCRIWGDGKAGSFYLGRPWRPDAHVVFIHSELGEIIRPEGWDFWGNEKNKETAYYAEYQNRGAGAGTAGRVNWSKQLTEEEAKNYTKDLVFGDWKPDASLPQAGDTASNPLAKLGMNPIYFGNSILSADPSAHVWKNGRLYVYASHDEECQEDFWMKDWHVFSTDNLVNWKDHGAILSVDDLSWADNFAWAPDCAFKNGKYYFCFPAGNGFKDRVNPEKSTKWMGIGIAVSDEPEGPFTDLIGGPLWTEPYANDPCLFVDDDQKAYLYVHASGADYKVAEMSDDMKSVKGGLVKMDMGGYEPKMEGPWIFKRKNKYYFTMPENNKVLTYYMSDSPKGPWKYIGPFMEGEHNSNNHHSIVEYQGQWILFYHRWIDTGDQCENRQRQRHVCAEYLYFNEDGTIQTVERTKEGLMGARK